MPFPQPLILQTPTPWTFFLERKLTREGWLLIKVTFPHLLTVQRGINAFAHFHCHPILRRYSRKRGQVIWFGHKPPTPPPPYTDWQSLEAIMNEARGREELGMG